MAMWRSTSRITALKTSALLGLAVLMSVGHNATADVVELVTGDTLHGKILEQTPQRLVLDHPALGRLEIEMDQVSSVLQDPGNETGDVTTSPTAKQEPPTQLVPPQDTGTAQLNETPDLDITPDDDSSSESFLDGWNCRLDIGANGKEGNSRTTDLRVALNADRETELDRWKYDAAYYYSVSSGRSTRNEFTTGFVWDWLRPKSPWFNFFEGRFDTDEFASWNQRVSGGAGMGYQFFDTPKLSLIGRLGLGGAKEFGSIDDEVRAEASIGGEMTWQITERQRLSITSAIYPDLTETTEFRVTASADWTLDIDQADGVQIKLGIQNEYESDVDPGLRKNDVKYYGALVFNF